MSVDVQKSLGVRIRLLRQRTNLTQEELAERCALTSKSISEIERGLVNVPLGTLVAIARALKVSISEVTLGIDGGVPRALQTVEQLLAGKPREQQTRILTAMQELLRGPVGGGLHDTSVGRESRSSQMSSLASEPRGARWEPRGKPPKSR